MNGTKIFLKKKNGEKRPETDIKTSLKNKKRKSVPSGMRRCNGVSFRSHIGQDVADHAMTSL